MIVKTITAARCVALLLLGLLVLSCSAPEPLKLRYEAEKRFHQAEKMAEDANARGEIHNAEVTRKIRDAYGQALDFSYAALGKVDQSRDSIAHMELSLLALRSAARLSQFFFAARNYDTCVIVLNHLLNSMRLPVLETGATWVNLGQALQAAGKWDSAIVIYNRTIDLVNPPVSQNGDVIFAVFNLPYHIYQVYQNVGDSNSARQQFEKALAYYGRFTQQYASTKLALGSRAMMANMYTQVGRYQEALAQLEQLKDNSGKTTWQAQSRMADIYAMNLKEYDRAYGMYDEVMKRLTGDDTIARPVLQFKQALVRVEQKRYDEARQMLVDISKNYRGYYLANPAPQYIKAKTFELEGNWERAETEYRYLIDNYPTSEQAMSAYLYLGEQLAERGRTEEADKWMAQADQFFSSVASRNPGTPVEARALSYRAELLRRNQNWPAAADMLVQIFQKFPDSQIGQRAMLAAAGITREKLNNPAKADSLVQSLKKSLTAPEENTES